MTWSCIHEGGHAFIRTGFCQAMLTVCHWANIAAWAFMKSPEPVVGKQYWPGPGLLAKQFLLLKSFLRKSLALFLLNSFTGPSIRSSPSLIRTEADELTYHFHVMIRYEIEKMLIDGSNWNSWYTGLLEQSLQRISWGECTGWQKQDLTGCSLEPWQFWIFCHIQPGKFICCPAACKFWKGKSSLEQELNRKLRVSIKAGYQKHLSIRQVYTSEELCEKATGETLNGTHFIRYANKSTIVFTQFKWSNMPALFYKSRFIIAIGIALLLLCSGCSKNADWYPFTKCAGTVFWTEHTEPWF